MPDYSSPNIQTDSSSTTGDILVFNGTRYVRVGPGAASIANINLYADALKLRASDGNPMELINTNATAAPNQHYHLFANVVKQVGATEVDFFYGFNSEFRSYKYYSKWSGTNKVYFQIQPEFNYSAVWSNLYVGDNARILFDETGLTAQRTYTFPDGTSKLVGDTTTQTLTNKKFITPKLQSSDSFEITINPGSANGANRVIDMADMAFNDGLLYTNHAQVTTNKQLQGIKYNQATKTSAYTLLDSDLRILGDASSAAFTLTLPAAASTTNRRYSFKKIDTSTNIVTIDANSSETIDGLLTWELRVLGDEVAIISDGSNWRTELFTDKDLLSTQRVGTTAPNRYRIAGQVVQLALGAATAVTANRLYAMPFQVDKVQTIDSVGVNVTTGVSSTNVRMGIYRNGNGVPSTLVADLGTVATTTPAALKEITGLSQKLQPDIYWLTAVFSGAPTISHLAQGSITSMFGSDSAAVLQTGMYSSFTYAALPSTYGTITMTTGTVSPALFYHFSA